VTRFGFSGVTGSGRASRSNCASNPSPTIGAPKRPFVSGSSPALHQAAKWAQQTARVRRPHSGLPRGSALPGTFSQAGVANCLLMPVVARFQGLPNCGLGFPRVLKSSFRACRIRAADARDQTCRPTRSQGNGVPGLVRLPRSPTPFPARMALGS
jgi:hypothetical protein